MRTFLLHGGVPDNSDQIDLYLAYLLQLGFARTKGEIMLTLFPAGKYNNPVLRERIITKINKISGGKCKVEELLLGDVPNGAQTPLSKIEDLCTKPNIFLIMNGDTRYVAQLSYEFGLPALLEQGNKNGMILSGWSCGAMIHSMASVSDSNAFAVDENAGGSWDWLIISKLNKTTFGSIDAVVCAHEGQIRKTAKPDTSRSKMHLDLVADQPDGRPAILLPENMAVQIDDGIVTCRDFTKDESGVVQIFVKNDGKVLLDQSLTNCQKYDKAVLINEGWGD